MKILLTIILSILPLISTADPLERFSTENIVKAVALKDKLVGTQWVYKWRGREYIFVFDTNGSISKLNSWSTVKWVVTGSNEVVLEGTTDRMILLFNSQATKFTSIDYNPLTGAMAGAGLSLSTDITLASTG